MMVLGGQPRRFCPDPPATGVEKIAVQFAEMLAIPRSQAERGHGPIIVMVMARVRQTANPLW
jgi:hypothetical protein